MLRIVKNKIIVVVSIQDIAGQNMKNKLLELRKYEKIEFQPPKTWPTGTYTVYREKNISILEIHESQIYSDYFTDGIECEFLFFASKHSSSAGQKALLVHTTGIWQKEAGHGGNDHELAYVPSDVLSFAYHLIKVLQEQRNLQYWTGIECTHHGPTALKFPIAYFEAGGTEDEWNDIEACYLIAKVIDETASAILKGKIPKLTAFIGIGGNHYCSRFIKLLDTGTYGLGHVLPKYAIDGLPNNMLKQAYEKTIASSKVFIIDKKGLKASDRNRFINYIETNGWDWQFG